jgi:aconitase A
MGFFPVDEKTMEYCRTGRTQSKCKPLRLISKQGLFGVPALQVLPSRR